MSIAAIGDGAPFSPAWVSSPHPGPFAPLRPASFDRPPAEPTAPDLSSADTLGQSEQEQLLSTIIGSKQKSLDDVTTIESTQAWQESATSRAQVLRLVAHLDSNGADTLTQFLSGAALVDLKDTKGTTLLQNLDLLASEPLNALITQRGGGESTRTAILDGVVNDLMSRNESIVEGAADTCASTSAEFSLVKSNQPEFVRLMAGLIGKDGKVDAAGGGKLHLQAGSFDHNGVVGERRRNAADAVFQSAEIESALPAWLTYNPANDAYELFHHGFLHDVFQHLTPFAEDKVTGMTGQWQADLLSNLMGGNFGVKYGAGDVGGMLSAMGSTDAARAHDFLRHYTGSDPVQITYHIPREPGWKVWKSHAVTLDHVDPATGNVYFRDPAGPQAKKGDYGDGHVDDANPGLYYMTRQEFLDSAISVVASSS